MLSKSVTLATTALIALMFSGCSLPWSGEEPANEVNLAFTIENNLIFLSNATINHREGRILFGSAAQHSVLDPKFAISKPYELELNARAALPMSPVVMDLHGVADAVVGSDVIGSKAVTIDYRSGLVTYQKDGIFTDYMTTYRFDAAPTIVANIDGHDMPVIVDTTLPDTIVLPRGDSPAGRGHTRLKIAGTDFGDVGVALDDVQAARIGNRLLSKFLVSIDYGKHQIGIWRDPRIR